MKKLALHALANFFQKLRIRAFLPVQSSTLHKIYFLLLNEVEWKNVKKIIFPFFCLSPFEDFLATTPSGYPRFTLIIWWLIKNYSALLFAQGKIANSNSETRSGFQPYRPEENRTSLSAQSTVPPPNPYGLDPTAAAAYSPYHAAAAAAAAAAAFYPPHLQHAYRYLQEFCL